MRENTGRQTVTQINFVGSDYSEREWTPAEAETMQWMIGAYASDHREVGQVFEYEEAGLHVTALTVNGRLFAVWAVTEDDVVRYHTAARTGRTLRIRYVKPDGSVSRREIEVTSVSLSKAGHTTVRAHDRKADDGRTFRADRITHTTLHRATAPSRPSKAALAAAFQAHVAPAAVTIPAPRKEQETIQSVTDVYLTTPGTAAALEAPEAVQDQIAERYALGHAYAFITI